MNNKKAYDPPPPPGDQGGSGGGSGYPPPPPSYQPSSEAPGTNYYTPPPQTNYPPPPPQDQAPPPVYSRFGNQVSTFYAPPQNRSLGLKRRCFSVLCCCILIGLIIGLAAGLSRRRFHRQCRTNADCIARFGQGTFCHSGRCVR
ncbi:hypothetical protein BCR43DRAFT_487133 [Syncephalastrum racemosum]|uniref:Uncharacterized protein n=1 Tax=Syncephalastrum racemosum TaxID=13706 RepID=A0A1X2HQD9_SYNRA|nr:hypothetical protein BCR43DRAFT_487133 [Syncephalastrum racemosum]